MHQHSKLFLGLRRLICMQGPLPLLQRLALVPSMQEGQVRLVVVLSQLGDFDSLEYATALARVIPRLKDAGIQLLAIAIGDASGADRFCDFTGFPRQSLQVDTEPYLHRELGLYQGLQISAGPWPALLLMCAGVGSSGTLSEVLRGYTGDHTAPALIEDEELVDFTPFPSISGSFFSRLGHGYLRPFELATIRLRNMVEVLTNWRTYVPCDDFLCQRGGTFLLDKDGCLLYEHRDRGILGFSETMGQPLAFLDPYL